MLLMRRLTPFALALCLASGSLLAQSSRPSLIKGSAGDRQASQTGDKGSSHHVFVSEDVIWTFEMVDGTPVLNIITFMEGEWPLDPSQVRIYNEEGKRARVRKFSFETGDRPMEMPTMKVIGDSFIGVDLVGSFKRFSKPVRVAIDLDKYRYELAPIDPLGFDTLAQKINQINYESPDISQDFEVLKIEPLGKRTMRPRR